VTFNISQTTVVFGFFALFNRICYALTTLSQNKCLFIRSHIP
jgi:hypothetical protein